MILYVESNFILELAYLQEEYEHCERILTLAEDTSIGIVVPAFALAEPYSTWVRQTQQRADLHRRLTREINQLSRSRPYAESQKEFQEVTKALLESGEDEKLRLHAVVERILAVASLIPLEAQTMRAAIQIQKSAKLEPQDSIIYASILSHLQTAQDQPKCFVSRDSDFADPEIRKELQSHGCDFAPNFRVAFGMAMKSTL